MKYLAVRLEYGRCSDGEIGKLDARRSLKNRYEDEFCVPGLQAYFKYWNASEYVIRDGYIPDHVRGFKKAYYLKASMFKQLNSLGYEKVVFFDNDIQVLDWKYNVWELPTLSGPKAGYENIFNKDIGLNFGLVVFDRETVSRFADLNPDQFADYELVELKGEYKISYDEYILLSHMNATGMNPNFINTLVGSGDHFYKRQRQFKFIHWIGDNWVDRDDRG